ncbi:uncharacterized protein [Procambarus clarkii]|uniref:uncharacterized protein n=1 Tax=Procambarus clarkii TaxID=6728 RepID=UPI00374302DB
MLEEEDFSSDDDFRIDDFMNFRNYKFRKITDEADAFFEGTQRSTIDLPEPTPRVRDRGLQLQDPPPAPFRFRIPPDDADGFYNGTQRSLIDLPEPTPPVRDPRLQPQLQDPPPAQFRFRSLPDDADGFYNGTQRSLIESPEPTPRDQVPGLQLQDPPPVNEEFQPPTLPADEEEESQPPTLPADEEEEFQPPPRVEEELQPLRLSPVGEETDVEIQSSFLPDEENQPPTPPRAEDGSVEELQSLGPPPPQQDPQPATLSQQIGELINQGRNDRLAPVADEEDADGQTLVRQPQRDGEVLITWFPLPPYFSCPETFCHKKYTGCVWTSKQQSLTRHLREIHTLPITSTIQKCAGCSETLGLRPTRHKCQALRRFFEGRPQAEEEVRHHFQCPTCTSSFTTKTGLNNHRRTHRQQDAVARRRPRPNSPPNPQPAQSSPSSSSSSPRSSLNPQSTQSSPAPSPHPPPSPQSAYSTPVSSPAHPAPDNPLTQHHLSQQQIPPHPSPLPPLPPLSPIPELGDDAPLSPASNTDNQDQSQPQEDDDDGGDDAGDEEQDQPQQQEENVPDEAEEHWLLKEFSAPLHNLLHHPDWDAFTELLQQITTTMQEHFKIQTDGSSTTSTPIDVNDCAAIQRLYRRNRRRAIRLITTGESARCAIPKERVEEHFTRTLSAQDPLQNLDIITAIPEPPEDRTEMDTGEFREREVATRLSRTENTAPGDDRLTYSHWKRADPECRVITAIFNICLSQQRIPEAWKSSRTVLIPKPGDPDDITNWRPIALCRTIYKLYTGCLSSRLRNWIVENKVLCPAQKGFMPTDGVLEHNFVLQHYLDAARTGHGNKDIYIASLDITNAFGSVPTELISAALRRMGAGDDFLAVINSITNGNTTRIMTTGGETAEIPANCGVRQGCPISGLLFNIAIEAILRTTINTGLEADPDLKHPCLAYADDITLLAGTEERLQALLNTVGRACQAANLTLNPNKCYSMHLSGQTPVGLRETQFQIAGRNIQYRLGGEHSKFLGRPVGFQLMSGDSSIDEYIELGKKVLMSKLAPWQRLDALKTFVFSSTVFAMRTWQFKKTAWTKLDDALKPHIKKTLYLPSRAANGYLYGSTRAGSCGIPLAAEDSDLFLIDTAFKLLNSPDVDTRDIAREDCRLVVAKRRQEEEEEVTPEHVCSYLSKAELPGRSSTIQTIWSRARDASGRMETTWTADGENISITCGDKTLKAAARRIVARTIRNHHRQLRDARLHTLRDQGKAMCVVSQEKASSHFMREGEYTTFADWRFVHRARLNLLPLNGATRRPNTNKNCRRCAWQNETLPHVMCHCMTYSDAYRRRHNALVDRIKTAALGRHWKVTAENQRVPRADSVLKPDLVIEKDNELLIIDVTCPFENTEAAFTEARTEKEMKYADLAAEMRALPRYNRVTVHAFIVGPLGSYDPHNERLMKRLASKKYLATFRKLCVSDAIRWSRMRYIEHITGARQYE